MDDYGSSAALYDRFMTPLLKSLREDVRTFIQHRGYRKVLDLCCGTGDQLKLLENGAEELVGIDNSEAMLARARSNCTEQVSLHLSDASQLDYPPGYFDCAILSFALHEKHQTMRDLIFARGREVVRQGGSLIITDFSEKPMGVRGFVLGDLLIPVIERIAGREHYLNYLSWKREGGIEGFLHQRHQTVDIISRRFGGSVYCCTVTIDDDKKAYQKHLALLNKSFSPPPTETSPVS